MPRATSSRKGTHQALISDHARWAVVGVRPEPQTPVILAQLAREW